jgi:GTPase
MCDKLSPEKEYGNIEYKLKLTHKKEYRIQELATQMRYRVEEGNGESLYVIGVTDQGNLVGVTDNEFTESFNNLSLSARKNNYSITILSIKTLKTKKKVYELLIREKNDNKYIDIKVAVAGSVDAGKSSLLGVLTSGKNDNGRGSARLSIFNFKHEVASGRTSSIAHHILGFDDKGQVMNYSGLYKKSWPDIIKDSAKVISFYDLCGHEKYLKTTILGLTSMHPDLCLILVGSNMGLNRITREHIFLCVTLKIPRKNVIKNTKKAVNKLLKLPGLRRIPYKIKNIDDVILCSKNIHSDSIVPIFYVSNVTGEGIDFVKHFLNLMSKSPANSKKDVKEVEYHIDKTFTVSGVGTVVGGQLLSGTISVGDKLMIGPNESKYREIHVRSIHCKKVPLQTVNYGSYVCLGLKKVDRKTIRRGNVIISKNIPQIAVYEFDAELIVLKSHSTTIRPGYEPIVHTSTMRQTAKLISIKEKINARRSSDIVNDDVLRTGDKAVARFRFVYRPEYIKAGDKLLMAEGKVKVVGIVK